MWLWWLTSPNLKCEPPRLIRVNGTVLLWWMTALRPRKDSGASEVERQTAEVTFLFYMGEGQAFSSILMFNWLDTAYPKYGGQCSFLCWLIPGFPEGSVVKNSLANVEDTRDTVHSLGLGRSSGVGSGNHYSILAWKIPWTGEPGRLYCMGSQSDMTEYTADSNVNPIQNRFIETLRKMSHQVCEQSMA